MVLLILDAHACPDNALLRRVLGKISAGPTPPPLLWLYDRGKEAELGSLLPLGIHYALPVPWDREAVRIHLKPLIGSILALKDQKRLQKELQACRQQQPSGREGCIELREQCESLQGFFSRESRELKEVSDKLTSLSAQMIQTGLSEREKKYIASLQRLLGYLERLSMEMKNHTETLSLTNDKEKSRPRNFNINNLFEQLADYLERKNTVEKFSLIFDVDNSVPAQLYGDPILLGKVLHSLTGMMIDDDGVGELVLRASLTPVPGKEKEKILYFEFFGKAHEGPFDFASFRKHLESGTDFRQAEQWIELMGGDLEVPKEQENEGMLLRFSVPVRQEERRSYRLPSSEWMNKRILIAVGNNSVAEALNHMLGYFHFPLTIAKSAEAVLRELDRQNYDVVFFDPGDFPERDLVQQIISAKKEAKLVVLSEDQAREEKVSGELLPFIEAFLNKPFTQEKIFEVILDLFAEVRLEETQESLGILKENLSFLVGRKKILFIGEKDSDWMLLKGMMEDTEIEMTQTENTEYLSIFLPSVDLVIVSGHLSEDPWKSVLEICPKECTDKILMTLLEPTERKRQAEAREAGIPYIIPTPIDPEYLYRLLLEVFLG
ncbi:response regulator [Nitratifractor salsuginis]|nr:response regulator [Nitratifractor salsuginis]